MKLDRAILIIAVVAVGARLIFVFAAPEFGGDWDIYAVVAENILRGCGVSLSDPSAPACVPHFGGNHLPGFPAFVAMNWFVFGHSEVPIRVIQTLL